MIDEKMEKKIGDSKVFSFILLTRSDSLCASLTNDNK